MSTTETAPAPKPIKRGQRYRRYDRATRRATAYRYPTCDAAEDVARIVRERWSYEVITTVLGLAEARIIAKEG